MKGSISERDPLCDQIETLLVEIKKMAGEINEIREMMAANIDKKIVQESLAQTNAEIAMVDTMGLDPVQYLREKSRKHRTAEKNQRGKLNQLNQ